ncbi:MAG: aldehyde dehydrogenase family protein [Frankia sp.]|nr:aldehyde dehydrogenase family protein [Frankia sp.]
MTTSVDAPELVRTGLFIGGEAHAAEGYLPIIDPARPGLVIGESAAATEQQALAAVAAAAAAFPAWSSLSAVERAKMISAAAATNDPHLNEIARVLTLENGKIFGESFGDALGLKFLLQMTEQLAPEVDEPVTYTAPPYDSEVHRLPLGVVTIILPFNWPLAILGASLPGALLAGNTVVVKPPRTAPLATVVAVERIAAALPPGVLNIITGEDAVIGTPLVANPDVAKVCFTGSVAGGKRIAAMAASTLTRVTLELGGNDPLLVLDDANLDDPSLDHLYDSVFATTGQICMAAKRLYVHRSRYDEVVDALTDRLNRARIGHGLAEGTTMGPLHHARQRDFVAGLVNEAKATGADVREHGELPDDPELADGHFIRPSLVLDPDPSLGIVTEEQFGPSIPIMPFDNVDDAVAAANTGWAGLGASVWSADEERGRAVARRLRAGYRWVNGHGATVVDNRAPFGGFKASGWGREWGIEGVRDFQDFASLTTVTR